MEMLNKEGESFVENNYSVSLTGNEQEPGRGHNDFFTENDTTFVVYHAYTKSADGASLLNIGSMYIDEKGWCRRWILRTICSDKKDRFDFKICGIVL